LLSPVRQARGGALRAERSAGLGSGGAFLQPGVQAAGDAAPSISVELDVVHSPSLFGSAGPLRDNSVTTVMGDVVFAGGCGRRRDGRRDGPAAVRRYASGGLGVMPAISRGPASTRIGSDDLGFGIAGTSRRGSACAATSPIAIS
jgi:hypothetical protein